MVKGNIIIVSGTSGAGKTTTCNMFAREAQEPYLTFGMDLLAGTLFPPQYMIFGEKRDEGYRTTSYGPMCRRALAAMHEMIAAASRAGQHMIVDHIMFQDPPVLQDCIWRMEDVPVWFICLKPPREVLEARQRHRAETAEFSAAAQERLGDNGAAIMKQVTEELVASGPWMYEHVYANDCYDIVIDTSAVEPGAVCKMISDRLSQGPGTAFAELRQRHHRQLF